MTALDNAASHRLDRLLEVAAAGVCASAALSLLARHGWAFELLSHFHLQYFVLLASLAAVLALRRRWRATLALTPFVAISALALAPYLPRAAAGEIGGVDLKLLAANLNGYHVDYARFVELARTEQPDVMILLEVSPGWAQALERLHDEFPFRLVRVRKDPYGIAILSRRPLLDAATIDLGGIPAVSARLPIGAGRQARVLGVHLSPPTSPRLAAERNAQLERLLPLANAAAGPLVVAGDFNATPYSPFLRDWLAATGLEDPRRGRGIASTWPTALALFGIPIDHCLVSEHFSVTELRQGAAFGSDHYPVIAELSLRAHE